MEIKNGLNTDKPSWVLAFLRPLQRLFGLT